MFTVYILHSQTLDKYYIGFTSQSLEERIEKHLCDHKGFTAKAKDWVVVFIEVFGEKSAAMKREKEIKNWKSKVMIRKMVADYKKSSSAG